MEIKRCCLRLGVTAVVRTVVQESGTTSKARRPCRRAKIVPRGGTEIKWRGPQLRERVVVRHVVQENSMFRKARSLTRRANPGAGALPENLYSLPALLLTIIYARTVQELPLSMLRQVLIAE